MWGKHVTKVIYINARTHCIGLKMYSNVCLGGTFDGIHAGHRLLLREGVRLTKERLVVGVTDGPMIKGKILWELIAPTEERMEKVREFLQSLNPDLQYQIVPIVDTLGPAVTDENLDCIVVSQETTKGAERINKIRSEKGWRELEVHIVDLLQEMGTSDQEAMIRLNENKLSSSLLRIQKLGTIIRPPMPNKSIPDRPYLIGLTGGVASGKSMVAEFLKSLGFGIINYDIMGHKTYERVGSPVYNEIVHYFGDEILDKQSRTIDRSKLGKIVFSDKSKLNKLNSIVWPAIYDLVDAEIKKMKNDHEVIVLESAIMIESNQNARVHQIWTTIVPPEEAVARQMKMRGLSKEEAENRINSQTDNLTRVQKSNAVFCSSWEPEFTQQQVLKCVKELREKYLDAKK